MYKIYIMLIKFTKMQGLGNDFMVVDNTNGDLAFTSEQVISLADRNFGIGFDQLLVVDRSVSADTDFRYTIYNSDGTQVSQCGNGARCFARYVKDRNLSNKSLITVETITGIMHLQINADDTVRVDMGKPNFKPANIPLLLTDESQIYSIEGHDVGALSIGNPHCILTVNDVDSIDIESIAKKIQSSDLLPEQANIGFMQVISANEINLRVYERGAGETLACGSGACAAVVYGVVLGKLANRVSVNLRGGRAVIEYVENEHVFLSGPGEFVFDGEIEI